MFGLYGVFGYGLFVLFDYQWIDWCIGVVDDFQWCGCVQELLLIIVCVIFCECIEQYDFGEYDVEVVYQCVVQWNYYV